MQYFGTLSARLYTSRAQIPVPGATVAVTQHLPDGRQALLAVRITDESGKIDPIRVETPPLAGSTSPGGVRPFALIDLWADAAGYRTVVARALQVFPGTDTVQELEMSPLPEPALEGERFDTIEEGPAQSL